MTRWIVHAYYNLRPVIPRAIQISLRRMAVERLRRKHRDSWPIGNAIPEPPPYWDGWPEGKRFALVLRHDVESMRGQGRCTAVADLEESMGFRSCFNFVPERYHVSPELRRSLVERGFEIGVHGLRHDGKLFASWEIFQARRVRINRYLKEWGSVGFYSPSTHYHSDWIRELNIEYDGSTFDHDPFEPYPFGVGSIWPFWVPGTDIRRGYVEIPYTLPQDFTLAVLLRERSIDVWKKKLDWVVRHGGLVAVNVHPDYMNFGRRSGGVDEYPARFYSELLEYIRDRYDGQFWHVLPRQLASYWKDLVMRMLGRGVNENERRRREAGLHVGTVYRRQEGNGRHSRSVDNPVSGTGGDVP